jgi:hypothetical protein
VAVSNWPGIKQGGGIELAGCQDRREERGSNVEKLPWWIIELSEKRDIGVGLARY